jgi:teichuronic acid exporter
MNIRQSLITGVKWVVVGKVLSQVVSWGVTIFVIRLLSPSDYGLMAVAMSVVSLLSHLNEFGLNSALVQANEISEKQCGAVFGMMLLISSVLVILFTLIAPYLAIYFEKPELSSIFIVTSITFLITAFGTVPNALLRKNMNFKVLASLDLINTLYSSLATLVLAQSGYGVWSLVFGNLIGSAINILMLYYVSPKIIIPNFYFSSCKNQLKFGCYLTSNRLIWWIMAQIDILIGAKLLNKEALGVYYVALDLAFMPLNKIMSIFNQVIFSAVSKIQNEKDILKNGLIEGIWWIFNALLPTIFGLIITAPEFFPLILGVQWSNAVLPFQFIALSIILRLLNGLFSTCNTAVGRIDVDFRNTITGALVMLPCFWYGANQGVLGLALAWPIGVVFVFAINFPKNSMVSGVKYSEIFLIAMKPLMVSVLMTGSVIASRYFLTNYFSQISLLLVMIFIGISVYLVVMLGVDKHFRYQLGKLLHRN